ADLQGAIVSLKVVTLCRLRHPTLVEISEAEIVRGLPRHAAGRDVVKLRWCPFTDHIFVRVVHAQTDLIIVNVYIPVASVQHGIVWFNHVGPSCVPFQRAIVTFACYNPEGSCPRSTDTLKCMQCVFHRVDAAHVDVFGNVLEREVSGIGYIHALCRSALLRGDQYYAECSLCTVYRSGCRVLQYGYRLDVVGVY